MTRVALAFAAAVLCTACGGTTSQSLTGKQAQAPVKLEPPPAIQSVDEEPVVADGAPWDTVPEPNWDGTEWCALPDGSTRACPSADQLAKVRQYFRDYEAATRLKTGTRPQTIARLQLAPGRHVDLTIWHNAGGVVCTVFTTFGPLGDTSSGSPGGPCDPTFPCERVCIGSTDDGDGGYVAAGLVDTSADALRVRLAGGEVREYPLTGPLVDGRWRVAMIDLGAKDFRKIEALQTGAVVGTRELPAFLVAFEACIEKLTAEGNAEKANAAALGKCVEEHPGGGWPGSASNSVTLQSK
jgi:hypothetical protein